VATGSSFDALFDGSDHDLFWGLIVRIEDRSVCKSANCLDLPPQSAALVRLAFLKTRDDNGGLLYVFECDRPDLGRAIAAALDLVGLHAGATVLRQAFDLFPDQASYDDWDRRFATIARVRPEFDRLDTALGIGIGDLEGAAARYIRGHRRDYEYLRAKPPYDSGTDTYDDLPPDAG
jgi:Domain of unknown function (DUF4375)